MLERIINSALKDEEKRRKKLYAQWLIRKHADDNNEIGWIRRFGGLSDTPNKTRFVEEGGAYFITVDNCNNPFVNSHWYWGPVFLSFGFSDGLRQVDTSPYSDSGKDSELIKWSLPPSRCPRNVLSFKDEKFIFLSDPNDPGCKTAGCINTQCRLNSNYQPPRAEEDFWYKLRRFRLSRERVKPQN